MNKHQLPDSRKSGIINTSILILGFLALSLATVVGSLSQRQDTRSKATATECTLANQGTTASCTLTNGGDGIKECGSKLEQQDSGEWETVPAWGSCEAVEVEDPVSECTNDSECDDNNPLTSDICQNYRCLFITGNEDWLPTPGPNCDVSNPSSFDDHDELTIDRCLNGRAYHTLTNETPPTNTPTPTNPPPQPPAQGEADCEADDSCPEEELTYCQTADECPDKPNLNKYCTEGACRYSDKPWWDANTCSEPGKTPGSAWGDDRYYNWDKNQWCDCCRRYRTGSLNQCNAQGCDFSEYGPTPVPGGEREWNPDLCCFTQENGSCAPGSDWGNPNDLYLNYSPAAWCNCCKTYYSRQNMTLADCNANNKCVQASQPTAEKTCSSENVGEKIACELTDTEDPEDTGVKDCLLNAGNQYSWSNCHEEMTTCTADTQCQDYGPGSENTYDYCIEGSCSNTGYKIWDKNKCAYHGESTCSDWGGGITTQEQVACCFKCRGQDYCYNSWDHRDLLTGTSDSLLTPTPTVIPTLRTCSQIAASAGADGYECSFDSQEGSGCSGNTCYFNIKTAQSRDCTDGRVCRYYNADLQCADCSQKCTPNGCPLSQDDTCKNDADCGYRSINEGSTFYCAPGGICKQITYISDTGLCFSPQQPTNQYNNLTVHTCQSGLHLLQGKCCPEHEKDCQDFCDSNKPLFYQPTIDPNPPDNIDLNTGQTFLPTPTPPADSPLQNLWQKLLDIWDKLFG